MSSVFETKIKSSSTHKDIIPEICGILDEKKISYSASQSEILIKDEKKEKIKSIVYSLPIEKSDLDLLVEIVKAKSNVYIRQKIS